MRSESKRIIALLSLALIIIMVLGTVFHDISPYSRHCCIENKLDCTLCAFKSLLSKIIYPICAMVLAVIAIQIIRERSKSIEYVPTARSFPMLC